MIALLARAFVVIIALSCVSCVSPRDKAVTAANAASRIADGAHELLARRYQSAFDACLTLSSRTQAEECGLDVEGRYDPAWRAYEALRAAWLVLAATVQAIDLLNEPVNDVLLLEMMVRLGESVTELQRAVAGLDLEVFR